MKPTLEQIREAQLDYYPDSVFRTLDEVLERWPNEYPSWVTSEQEVHRYQHQVQRSLLTALRNITVCDWQYQFYECGLQEDGTYQWRGMRFGLEGHQYQSGFGYF